ncbi:unnamed protein product [Dovyalis caffra]|uniref:Uncharacterized protein n=1 Tax=Dovyalis caffra TaxID=77055 RepID=A0AAV1SLZ1_9ROSI|nr:unnamed protein product [Dovyalis caffra]
MVGGLDVGWCKKFGLQGWLTYFVTRRFRRELVIPPVIGFHGLRRAYSKARDLSLRLQELCPLGHRWRSIVARGWGGIRLACIGQSLGVLG